MWLRALSKPAAGICIETTQADGAFERCRCDPPSFEAVSIAASQLTTDRLAAACCASVVGRLPVYTSSTRMTAQARTADTQPHARPFFTVTEKLLMMWFHLSTTGQEATSASTLLFTSYVPTQKRFE